MNEYQYILSYLGFDSGNDQTLTINPDGWNESGIEFVRSDHYHSIFRSYSDTIKFARKSGATTADVGGGGDDIILFAYDEDGVEALVNCTVNKRNPQTGAYDLFYSGILDYNPESFSWDEEFVTISFIDGQKENLFKSRDKINYDLNSVVSTDGITIDSFVSQPAAIEFKKIDIYRNVEATIELDFFADTNVDWGSSKYGYFQIQETPEPVLNEIGSGLLFDNDFFYENITNSDVVISIYQSVSFDYNMEYIPLIIGNNSGGAVFGIAFTIYDENDVFVSVEWVYNNTLPTKTDITGNQNESYTANFLIDYSETVLAGYKISYYIQVIHVDLSNMRLQFEFDNTYQFEFKEQSIGEPDENIDCYYPYEAFTRLIQLMTSETDTSKLFYSTKLGRTDSEFTTYATNGLASETVLTSGWNLRKFPDKSFNLNMSDLFKDYDSIYNLGLGFDRDEDRFYVEDKSYFYNSGLLMFDLGEVSDVDFKPYKKGYFNKINGGYGNKIKYDQFQGSNIYNVQTEHSLTTPIDSVLDLRTKHNSDSIGMELARRLTYNDSKSEDSDYDENIYIVVTDSGVVMVNGSTVNGFDGVDEYYNVAITPRENLIRWSNWISIPMWKKTAFDIKFVKSQKNVNITYISTFSGATSELSDLTEADMMASRLFNPEMATFKSKITTAMMTQLNTNPHGIVKFASRGTDYYGFIDRCKTTDYNNNAEFDLILTDEFESTNAVFEDDNNIIFEDNNNEVFES